MVKEFWKFTKEELGIVEGCKRVDLLGSEGVCGVVGSGWVYSIGISLNIFEVSPRMFTPSELDNSKVRPTSVRILNIFGSLGSFWKVNLEILFGRVLPKNSLPNFGYTQPLNNS